ncbi:DUF6615 family protein [Luteimonas abyssi]|uniref:DUF6615 family protein n=1 Tax=Luteimonas abyssi TaxID=1247514 RepID=UPI000737B0A0|nr:DUF6615 family protein [Luteimonas abyssi]
MLCSVVQKQSRRVWRTLSDAAKLSCSYNEESLTDGIVLALAKGATTGGYTVDAFSKMQEAVNGADWELWFTGPSGLSFGYRIQSKKMKIGATYFPSLHKVTKGVAQVDKLINASALVQATPIFALYSTWPAGTTPVPIWKCGTYPTSHSLWGMAAASAPALKALNPMTTLGAVAPLMVPFHCLVCCSRYGGGDLPTRAAAFAREHLDGNARLLEDPPAHVARLMSNRKRLGEAPEAAEAELPPDLSRVIVVHENPSLGTEAAAPKQSIGRAWSS